MPSTVLLVDDHDGFRRHARRVLENDGYQVIGEAASVGEGLAQARKLRPQIALVDVHLPDGDGLSLAGSLAALDPPPAVILTSSYDPSELEPLAADSPARGFVPKDKLSRTTIDALL